MDTELYLKNFTNELNEQVWRKAVNLEFDLNKIPDVKKLQDDKQTELDGLRAELDAIPPRDTSKSTRMHKKELENNITKAEEFIVSCDETISLINESVRKDKEKIKSLLHRVEFAKDFKYDQSKYADDN
jgi:enoyl-[acyl-carrier-protein] reductase (NADH)